MFYNRNCIDFNLKYSGVWLEQDWSWSIPFFLPQKKCKVFFFVNRYCVEENWWLCFVFWRHHHSWFVLQILALGSVICWSWLHLWNIAGMAVFLLASEMDCCKLRSVGLNAQACIYTDETWGKVLPHIWMFCKAPHIWMFCKAKSLKKWIQHLRNWINAG